jgi:hypothetical protein
MSVVSRRCLLASVLSWMRVLQGNEHPEWMTKGSFFKSGRRRYDQACNISIPHRTDCFVIIVKRDKSSQMSGSHGECEDGSLLRYCAV